MKDILNTKINSQDYWNKRFEKDWEEKQGKEQTKMFYSIMLKNLPSFLLNYIKKETKTINDIGCALGEGTFLIQTTFPQQQVEGTDFSVTAINKAKERYPDLNFSVQDIKHIPQKYDVIVASNIVEHFSNPLLVIQEILKHTNKLAIIMLPFQEDKSNLGKEHFQSFDFKDFPIVFSNYFLLYSKEIDLSGTSNAKYWNGKQLLLIYSNIREFSLKDLTLENYHAGDIDKNKEIEELRAVKKEFAKIDTDYKQLKKDFSILNRKFDSLNNTNSALSQELNTIKNSSAWKLVQAYYNFLGKYPNIKKIVNLIHHPKK